jgi:hypothetical protein
MERCMWWRRQKKLAVNHEVAARRVKLLSANDLVDAAYSTTATVNKNIRTGNVDEAELYSEVLVVIVRELKSRE